MSKRRGTNIVECESVILPTFIFTPRIIYSNSLCECTQKTHLVFFYCSGSMLWQAGLKVPSGSIRGVDWHLLFLPLV